MPDNAWLGVSVEDKKYGKPRIPDLQAIKTNTRFLSIEPLLENLGWVNLEGIHWVIVGGESGFGTRPMREEWALSLRDQCKNSGVDFFFKRWTPGVGMALNDPKKPMAASCKVKPGI